MSVKGGSRKGTGTTWERLFRRGLSSFLRGERKTTYQHDKICALYYERNSDIRLFLSYVELDEWGREEVLRFKEYLREHYKVSSANSMLASLNCFLKYEGRMDCCVQTFRQQRQIFRDEKKELSRSEYKRLVMEAERRGNHRLSCILQTIGEYRDTERAAC